MTNWRQVFNFDGEDLDFETVHMRYREKILQLPVEALDRVECINLLNEALDAARRDLVTTGKPATR